MEGTMQTYFEATPKQKELADIGRDMMNWSEEYGKINGLKAVTDDGLRTLNNLSHVGNLLTQFGAPYGTTQSDFTEADRKLIADWMQKKVDIERK
jgi:hypothetical protein